MPSRSRLIMPLSVVSVPAVLLFVAALFFVSVDAQVSDSTTPSVSPSPSAYAFAQSAAPWVTSFLAGGGGGSGTPFPAAGAASGIGTNALFNRPTGGCFYTQSGNNFFVVADTQNNVLVSVTMPLLGVGIGNTIVLAGAVSALARQRVLLSSVATSPMLLIIH